MANLLLCITQGEILKPYKFKSTNIQVFSLEEALYHCYHYWKQSVDDFLSDDFILWVHNTLELPFIASKLRDMTSLPSFSEKYCAFLTVINYFSKEKIDTLKIALNEWENRFEWEKLKERGDYLMNNGEPNKAFALYKRALAYSENAALLNNIAIALMKQAKHSEACHYCERALEVEPQNRNLSLNYIEALILSGQYDKAWLIIGKFEAEQEFFGGKQESDEISYFKGEINFFLGNYYESVPFYERAISLSNGEPLYIYRLCDVFIKLRQYDKALETINRSTVRDKLFLRKQADIYVAYNDIPAAIKCIEKALVTNKESAELWIRLANYHRLDYDLTRANNAIVTALELSPGNPRAKLEFARIRKAQGRIKEYQSILSDVLSGFKSTYRDNADLFI